ncbi:hypothetical protein scyTo_0017593 [Scyliorhinus torazame]|uniref:PDZ domain-containing protein n=1 Tax=Scyliorhinus torazame TaxID=75743 RepID=A0A401PW95_SCYTO|nr:hypothetical protein [Scyliorhinus torazame]
MPTFSRNSGCRDSRLSSLSSHLTANSFSISESRSEKAKRLFRHYTVGSYDSFDAPSDYIIKEKTVLLQKKDSEGFGFVLRGAKGELCQRDCVNGQNVVKVGHRQVVNMIRQGGNNLMLKVVMVTRNPDMEEASRKKDYEPQQSTEKRRKVYQMALNRLDEILAAAQQSIANESAGTQANVPKPRTAARTFYSAEVSV